MRSGGSRAFGVVALAFAAVFLLAPPDPARAEVGVIHPEVTRLAGEATRARGPAGYAAIREILSLWDQADPATVEEAVRTAAEGSAVDPALRVYARSILAEARSRRGDIDGARALTSGLGYVDSWLFVGPFDDDNKTGFGTAYQPETELDQPVVPGRAFDGKERPVRWRSSPDSTGAVLDLGDFLRPRDKVCGYATTFVTAAAGAKAPTSITVFAGAEGAVKAWWNGELVLQDSAYRSLDYDRVGAVVPFASGVNRLTVKVCSDGAPAVAVRLGDAKGGPITGVVASGDPAKSEAAASTAKERAAKAKAAKPSDKPQGLIGTLGPLPAFEKITAGAKPRAEDLEAYARYLLSSGGDPRGEHVARDLAGRAAEAEPTWRRLLLAAQVAEDRNQSRVLVERADAKAKAGDVAGRVAVLVMKARLARTGINWRDAVPFYEEALALDPDSITAVLGRTELYVQAGLPRTALSVLERAVERQPHCVALLRIYAVQLRALGRDTEADDIDARWYALRSDDSAFAARQVDRAVADRDVARAEKWLARLRRVEPDLVFALAAEARTYRSLGQPAKARHALEVALDVAPEETSTLRALADLEGESGDREGQLRYLRKLLALYPQAKEVRAYLEFLAPSVPRKDEQYAWDKDKLAELGKKPQGKERQRTLRDLAVTSIYTNGLASRFHQVVFQPLTEEAAAEARQYFIQYEGDKQDIELRLARVYRKDGTVAEATESGESAANNPAIAMYTSVRVFTVSFPRLSPGDVVELRYRVDDVAVRNEVADQFSEIEFIQGQEPTLSSEYVVIAPKARPLKTFVANLEGVTKTEKDDGDEHILSFSATDVPALTIEPGMPPAGEVAGQIHVSTFASWEALGLWYWGLARDQLDVDDEVRKKVREIAGSAKTDEEKIRAVYRYATLLRYVALEFGIEGIKPRRCALSVARGWGDCKDKATVIVTMLRELGIPAKLVLVRTGMKGDLPKGAPASISAFDHAIAYVPSLDLFLDGTAEGSGSTELPGMDRGSVALVIDEQTPKLVRMPEAAASASPHLRKVELGLAADGSADLRFESNVKGVHAAGWRGRYHAEGTRRERATQDLSRVFGAVEIGKDPASLVVKDSDDVEKAITLEVKGRAAVAARKEGDALSVPAAASLELVSTLATLSSRKMPLVVGGLSLSEEERTIKLPAGMKVRRLPDAVSIDNAYGTVQVDAKQEGGKVVIKSRMLLKKPRIQPAEYAGFREFCQKADDALSQRVVVGP